MTLPFAQTCIHCDAIVTDKHDIAPRLIASAEELELLAGDDNAPIRALTGWRREEFGDLALRLK